MDRCLNSSGTSGSEAAAGSVPLPDYLTNILPGVLLAPGERLQVHVDCMNAVGDIVTVEDVDDMGGSVSSCVYGAISVFLMFGILINLHLATISVTYSVGCLFVSPYTVW